MSVRDLHLILNLFRGIYKQVEEDWENCARAMGLTAPQLHILWVLSFEDGLNLSDISRRSLLHISTVSDLVKRMEKKGLVIRREGLDRRKVTVYITDKGLTIQQKNQEHCLNYFKISGFLNNLAEDEKKEFLRRVTFLAGELRDDNFIEWVLWSGEQLQKD